MQLKTWIPFPCPKAVRPSPVVAVMPIEFSGIFKSSERLFLSSGILGVILGIRHSMEIEKVQDATIL